MAAQTWNGTLVFCFWSDKESPMVSEVINTYAKRNIEKINSLLALLTVGDAAGVKCYVKSALVRRHA